MFVVLVFANGQPAREVKHEDRIFGSMLVANSSALKDWLLLLLLWRCWPHLLFSFQQDTCFFSCGQSKKFKT